MASATQTKTAQIAVPAKGSHPGRGIGLELIAAVLLAACGHLLIKHGLNSAAELSKLPLLSRLWGYILIPKVIGGLAVYGIGTMLWIISVSRRDISYLYPITALNYILVSIGGMWLFGEAVSPRLWFGILIVMIGVAVLQTSTGRTER